MDTEQQKKGIGLIPLAALVIGSAIGGGVFGIMTDISGSAGGPAIFSWVLVGTAMLMLSLSINNINKKRPDLKKAGSLVTQKKVLAVSLVLSAVGVTGSHAG
ncbi:hypothetical protein NWO25_14205 [Enterococcus lactis]|nr:hypothetical protein [Enterococcus lactis]